MLPGNIALDLRDPDEDDWMAKMHVEQLRARIKRKEENKENNAKAYSSPKSEDTTNKKKEKGDGCDRNVTFDDQGRPIKVSQVKTEKLPSVAGY